MSCKATGFNSELRSSEGQGRQLFCQDQYHLLSFTILPSLKHVVLPNAQWAMFAKNLLYSFCISGGINERESVEAHYLHFESNLGWDLYLGQSVGKAAAPRPCITSPWNPQQPMYCPQSQLGQGWILVTPTWGFRSCFIYILGFLYRFLSTSHQLNRQDCDCRWERRKPACLHCWLETVPKPAAVRSAKKRRKILRAQKLDSLML